MSLKKFDDPEAYEQMIRKVVPGYELIQSLAVAEIAKLDQSAGHLYSIGPGTGEELMMVAETLPDWEITAFEPAKPMAETAHQRTARANLDNLDLRNEALKNPPENVCDAAFALLVPHVIPLEKREAFWQKLGEALKPGGVFVDAQIATVEPGQLGVWLTWSRIRGAVRSRIERLEERLTSDFATLPFEESRQIANQAGFEHQTKLAEILDTELHVWVRPS